ncbi:unnamed protein product [Zymoseptoria tritici ST99CH_1E4]|uniref:Uncharacterized protein n=1 Tax=Zymoseptoria tritici ST99CH_1E4 TaxID=1276532 RepID=A0A2H1FZB3_ZYMTR|nr:unnamed protein product [Zymoseptoria tritici ST99CH_1E4]
MPPKPAVRAATKPKPTAKPTRRPLQTLQTTSKTKPSKKKNPQPPLPPPQNAANAMIHLDILNGIIETELTFWMDYLKALPSHDFSTLTADSPSPQLLTQALIHILESLPLRHRALAAIYSDPDVEPVVLPGGCDELLRDLKRSVADVVEEVGMDHEKKLFSGKVFRQGVLALEAEVKVLEEARMEELKGLMGLVEMLRLVGDEGRLGNGELKVLIEAMDEAGLSGLVMTEGGLSDVE